MTSAIDPTKPEDGIPAEKDDLRNNFLAGKNEIEDLQLHSLGGRVIIPPGATNLTEALHYREFIVGSTGGGPVELTLPAEATFPHTGRIFEGICASGANAMSIEVNPGDVGNDKMRSRSPYQVGALSDEKIYIGASTPAGDEAPFEIWRRSGFWIVTSAYGLRPNINDDVNAFGGSIPNGSITPAHLSSSVGRFAANNIRTGNETLQQTDEDIKLIWTSQGGTFTIPFLSPGSVFTIKNVDSVDGTLAASGGSFDFQNGVVPSLTLPAGGTVVLDMRRGSTLIDVSKDL